MTSTHWINANSTGVEELDSLISQLRAEEPLRPVDVVVSSNQVGVSIRRRLSIFAFQHGKRSSATSTNFLTLDQLCLRHAEYSPMLAGRKRLTRACLNDQIREVLRTNASEYSASATSDASISAISSAYHLWRIAGSESSAEKFDGDARLKFTMSVCSSVLNKIAPSFYDRIDLLEATEALIRSEGASPVNPVVILTPEDISRQEVSLVEAIGLHTRVEAIHKLYGEQQIDNYFLRIASALDSTITPPTSLPNFPNNPYLLIEAVDPKDEVRSAVEGVQDALLAGVPLSQIEIAYTQAEQYLEYLISQLRRASIPIETKGALHLGSTLPATTLLRLLEFDGITFQGDAVMDLLSVKVLQEQEGSDNFFARTPLGHDARVAVWRTIVRSAGLSGGTEHWRSTLRTLLERQSSAILKDRELLSLRSYVDLNFEVTSLLKEFEGLVSIRLSAAQTTNSWLGWAHWLTELLTNWLSPHLGLDKETDLKVRPEDGPSTLDQVALTMLFSIAVSLSDLTETGSPVTFDRFVRAVSSEISATRVDLNPESESVHLRPLSRPIGSNPTVSIIVGLAEDSYPSSEEQDSVLYDFSERLQNRLGVRMTPGLRRKLTLHQTLQSANRSIITQSRQGILAGSRRTGSNLLEEILSPRSLPDTAVITLVQSDTSNLVQHRVQLESLFNESKAIDSTELQILQASYLTNQHGDLDRQVQMNPLEVRSIKAIRARSSAVFTNFDGLIPGYLSSERTEDHLYAATALEQWVTCPYSYFVNRILRITPSRSEQDRFRLLPADRGDLIHATLKYLFDISENDRSQTSPAEHGYWNENTVQMTLAYADELIGHYREHHRFGANLFYERDRSKILADLTRVIHSESTLLAESGSVPIAAEASFGSNTSPPLTITTQDGRSIGLRGVIDRVDIDAGGNLTVVDYKTGSSSGYTRNLSEDPLDGGRRLQLPLYALAASRSIAPEITTGRMMGEYVFVSNKDTSIRKSIEITDQVVSQLESIIGVITEAIELGVFIQGRISEGPFEHSCPYCDPLDGRPRWHNQRLELKMNDPMLARFLTTVIPDQTDTGSDHVD